MVPVESVPLSMDIKAMVVVAVVPMIMGVMHVLSAPIVVVERNPERCRICGVTLRDVPTVSVPRTHNICRSG